MTTTEKPAAQQGAVGTAVAEQQKQATPVAMIKRYMTDFETVLPSHINSATWVRIAQGALKKGKKVVVNGRETEQTELELAAHNKPGVFMAALLDAARLGLDPGTEQYYLTPRKVKGQLEILGIVGYQGIIELMYRSGAISSVVVEPVYAKDIFTFMPGRDEVPQHEIDWDADDRGALRLVYAFARMTDGGTSKVVVLNREHIARAKKSATGSDSEYSPWNTHEEAMWMKTAARRLSKWVPTSAEFIRERVRAVAGAQAEQARGFTAPALSDIDADDGVIDGEVVA